MRVESLTLLHAAKTGSSPKGKPGTAPAGAGTAKADLPKKAAEAPAAAPAGA